MEVITDLNNFILLTYKTIKQQNWKLTSKLEIWCNQIMILMDVINQDIIDENIFLYEELQTQLTQLSLECLILSDTSIAKYQKALISNLTKWNKCLNKWSNIMFRN